MIELDNVAIQIGPRRLERVRLRVDAGQYAVLMGRTGSGKTSILEAICGLRPVVAGRILLNDQEVTSWSPARRQIGYVPQDMALFTTKTVRQNLAFALDLRRWPPAETDRRAHDLATLLEIDHLLDRRPHGLSGGEARRVALGRALAFRPQVLLLDEPLTGLDESTRDSLYELLLEVRRTTGVTVLHVTHSETDVERLADVRFEVVDGRIGVKQSAVASRSTASARAPRSRTAP